MRRYKPSTIDRQLIGKPELRMQVEALAMDYGLTIEELVVELAKLGIPVSRTSAGRYRLRLRPCRSGPISPLAAGIIAKVLTLRGNELIDLAKRLNVKVAG